MDVAGRTYIFDLHNTLYDEVREYAGAIESALECFYEEGRRQDIVLDPEIVCGELSAAHARCGSDWDDAAWDDVPSLKALAGFSTIRDQAVARRLTVSKSLTKGCIYQGVSDTLKKLKEGGARLYIATEATENALADAVRWLGVDGIIDAAYAWPSGKPYEPLKHTAVCRFPRHPHDPSFSLEKPHPLIVGAILLDEARRRGMVPPEVEASDVFSYEIDKERDLGVLEEKLVQETLNDRHVAQARYAIEAMRTQLAVKSGPYAQALEALRDTCFYVGDSYFKDGCLARNAGVPFIHAAYGKKAGERTAQDREILYKVTGWNKFLLRLTQEAGSLPSVSAEIKPHFVCNASLQEILSL